MSLAAALACPLCAGTSSGGAAGSLALLGFLAVPALVVLVAALLIRRLSHD